ncbi:hypothetical protein MANES_09G078021v8 [Manihot esculenta]|uniref:Uncharacterized protein n=2 Tax=Manihot esculenta TaxID=3983 RepID=A0ACB7H3N0_MANES|nr:hypothetical protein MANES_09G078021v8 [Manihot esculenta]KAG8647278.1 hypothetical protein MANES_09G078021v8 [Manihot esculenta]
MEIKRSVTSIFLLLLLLVLPRGRCQVAEPDIFEIDYRGPETHSSALPPPGGRSHGRPFIHGDQAAARNSNGNRQNAKKIHG